MKEKKQNMAVRIIIYLIGLMIIALGINISKKSALGISPVSSIPGVLNAIFPSISLGSMVIVVYCLLVLAQFAVLRKKFKAINILGVPVALVFGLMVDFLGTKPFKITLAGIPLGIETEFHGLLEKMPDPSNIALQFVFLFASIIIIGIGVAIYLYPKLVPMPAEGLAAAIATVKGSPFGNCKTYVDVGLIATAAILQIIKFGFGSLWIGNGGVVGIGTILAAICVGQVVKFINKHIIKK